MIIGTDGTKVCAVLDRNGLRPCRYLVTTDDLLVMASETGVLDVPPEKVRYKERIYPGRMFLLDTEQRSIVGDEEIKSQLSAQRPYGAWLAGNRVALDDLPEPAHVHGPDSPTLPERQAAFGYTLEDMQMIMEPMAITGAEPVGSMGNDAPLAVLSDQTPLVFGYFKQLFAQVSNPPLDAIREELVTSLESTVGSERNLFDETPEHARQLRLKSPVLTNLELEKVRHMDRLGIRARTLSTLFRPEDGPGTLRGAMGHAVRRGLAGRGGRLFDSRPVGPRRRSRPRSDPQPAGHVGRSPPSDTRGVQDSRRARRRIGGAP